MLCYSKGTFNSFLLRPTLGLSVASYDSQDYGGGILSRLRTGSKNLQSQNYLTTDGQAASLSWCQATIRASDQVFFLLEIFIRQLQVSYFVAPSLTRGRVCNLALL
jgi:hypothetical protein